MLSWTSYSLQVPPKPTVAELFASASPTNNIAILMWCVANSMLSWILDRQNIISVRPRPQPRPQPAARQKNCESLLNIFFLDPRPYLSTWTATVSGKHTKLQEVCSAHYGSDGITPNWEEWIRFWSTDADVNYLLVLGSTYETDLS